MLNPKSEPRSHCCHASPLMEHKSFSWHGTVIRNCSIMMLVMATLGNAGGVTDDHMKEMKDADSER